MGIPTLERQCLFIKTQRSTPTYKATHLNMNLAIFLQIAYVYDAFFNHPNDICTYGGQVDIDLHGYWR